MKEQTEFTDQELSDFIRKLRETRRDVTAEKLRRQFDLSLNGAEAMVCRMQACGLIGGKTRAGYSILVTVDEEKVRPAAPDSQTTSENTANQCPSSTNQEGHTPRSGHSHEAVKPELGAGESSVISLPTSVAYLADERMVPLGQIIRDDTVQPRTCLDTDVMGNYADLMRAGVVFPAITVFEVAVGKFVLADGSHRVEAGKRAGFETINATVMQGTLRDALLFAIHVNASHGQGLTRKEKLRAATRLLNDPQWSQWSNSEIARICGLSGMHVGRLRKEADSNSVRVTKRKSRGRNGKVRVMETSRMGRKKCRAVSPAANPDGHADDRATSGGPSEECAITTPPLDPVAQAVDRLRDSAASFLAVATTPSDLHSVDQDRLVNLRLVLTGIIAILPEELRAAA